jgi:3-oxoacyl-(acyl-carrier-protein) synthase
MEHELMKHRVVVTGLGLVTPLGNTVEATWAGLMAGRARQRRQPGTSTSCNNRTSMSDEVLVTL